MEKPPKNKTGNLNKKTETGPTFTRASIHVWHFIVLSTYFKARQ